ncbi:MAG: barstar family protein [Pyrinomonadaceae bacterium]
MKAIELNARSWQTADDFYISLLPNLGAPQWHGHNLDALWDSIARGGINEVDPPFVVRVVNLNRTELKEYLLSVQRMFREAKEEGIDIELELPL